MPVNKRELVVRKIILLLLSLLISDQAFSNEPVLSRVIPRIPSEARCELARLSSVDKPEDIQISDVAFHILGNCYLKKETSIMLFIIGVKPLC